MSTSFEQLSDNLNPPVNLGVYKSHTNIRSIPPMPLPLNPRLRGKNSYSWNRNTGILRIQP